MLQKHAIILKALTGRPLQQALISNVITYCVTNNIVKPRRLQCVAIVNAYKDVGGDKVVQMSFGTECLRV